MSVPPDPVVSPVRGTPTGRWGAFRARTEVPAPRRSRGRMRPLRWIVGLAALLWLAQHLPQWGMTPPTGMLTVTAGPVGDAAAAVLVDGAVRGRPGEAIRLPAGEHRVALRAEGWEADPRMVAVPAGGRAEVALRPRARPVPVAVDTVPAGAALVVDGRDAGSAPTRLWLAPGAHRVRAVAEGYAARTRFVRLRPGEAERTLRIVLPAIADPAPDAPDQPGPGD